MNDLDTLMLATGVVSSLGFATCVVLMLPAPRKRAATIKWLAWHISQFTTWARIK